MLLIKVFKENTSYNVALMNHKGTHEYSYVNLTKGHICSCVFKSIEDALNDIEERKQKGLLKDYTILTNEMIEFKKSSE